MPKYIFICQNCSAKNELYVSFRVETKECTCGGVMHRQLPKIGDLIEVRELVDPYLNKSLNKNHDDILKERKETYYWEIEVPRLIEKYSLETCLEEGWLIYNDKGELTINKKPSKR